MVVELYIEDVKGKTVLFCVQETHDGAREENSCLGCDKWGIYNYA